MEFSTTINKEKNGALLAYICQNVPGINLRKLLKLVYLIDERFVMKRCFPLTWFSYQAWEKGPVSPEVYDIKNGAFSEFVSCEKNSIGKNIISPKQKNNYLLIKDMDNFSQYEMNLIDSVLYEYKDKSADELSDITHAENSLWTKTINSCNVFFVDGKSDVEIHLSDLNDTEDKRETYSEALEYMQICS